MGLGQLLFFGLRQLQATGEFEIEHEEQIVILEQRD